MPHKHSFPVLAALLLSSVPCVAAQSTTSAWDVIEDASRATMEDLWNLHKAHPELVPPPKPPETNPDQTLLRLQILTTQLGEARARIHLDLPPGAEHAGVEDLAAAAHSAFIEGTVRAQEAIDQWSNTTLPPPANPGLEDAWVATRPALSILEAGAFMDRMPKDPDASAILLLVQGIETNVALLDALQPIFDTLSTPDGENLTAADVEQVRDRLRYGPAMRDPKVEAWDHRSRAALTAGEVQLALAYALFAETANTNQRAYDAVFRAGYDLLPSLNDEHARWKNATPSLLLRHAQESADAVLAVARENATMAASSTKVQRSAGDALAGYAAVALLRDNAREANAADMDPGSRETSLPPHGQLLAVLAAAVLVRRTSAKSPPPGGGRKPPG